MISDQLICIEFMQEDLVLHQAGLLDQCRAAVVACLVQVKDDTLAAQDDITDDEHKLENLHLEVILDLTL